MIKKVRFIFFLDLGLVFIFNFKGWILLVYLIYYLIKLIEFWRMFG